MRASMFVALVLSCGGRTSSDQQGIDDAGNPITGSSESGGVPWASIPTCGDAGIQREAAASEMAQYCICSLQGDKTIWECYGPAPSAPVPHARCSGETGAAGSGHGSCSIVWNNCSDGKTYALECVETECYCTVAGIFTVLLPPQVGPCPLDKASLNRLCGWALQ